MKRYVKSSFEITVRPQYKYKNYAQYCLAEMGGYFSEELSPEDYQEDIKQTEQAFYNKFHRDLERYPIVTAYVGFVYWAFIVTPESIYTISWGIDSNKPEFVKVDQAWLDDMGCQTTLDEVYNLLSF